ncbi:hypothetical protein ACFQT0_12830 [Hymenobacter humi]|uniref:Uncharacterized protein n=1 Tax=Hymenobacter humi TaxID=1411620 RepID=A0ABW2U582_9BACT
MKSVFNILVVAASMAAFPFLSAQAQTTRKPAPRPAPKATKSAPKPTAKPAPARPRLNPRLRPHPPQNRRSSKL